MNPQGIDPLYPGLPAHFLRLVHDFYFTPLMELFIHLFTYGLLHVLLAPKTYVTSNGIM